MLGNITPEKLCAMLHRRDKNKMTMAYWLYLAKYQEGKLTEEELQIIENGKKDISLLESTAADLLDGKNVLSRTMGGTGSILRKSSRKLAGPELKDKNSIRLPTIVRNSSIESKGSTERSKETPKYMINRGGSKDKLMLIFESPTTPLSNT